jgi:3-hydroxybutyryl-CoA dehydratase
MLGLVMRMSIDAGNSPWTVGQTFKRTFTLTPTVYEGFLATFGDRHPLHTDAEFARSKGFSNKVMHGNILNGFVSYFVGECLPSKDVMLHKQEIRFRRPVYLDQVLDFEAELVHHSEAVGVLEFTFGFKNGAGEAVATGKLQVGVLGG